MTPQRDRTDQRMRRLTGRSFNGRRTLRHVRRRLGLPRSGRSQLLLAAAVVAAALVVWGVVDLAGARSDLLAARRDLSSAAGNLGATTDAQTTAQLRHATRDAVARTTHAKRRLQRAPLLRLLDVVPVVRGQRHDLLRAVDVANRAAVAGDTLARRLERVRDGITVKSAKIDVAAMNTLADAADEAGATLAALPRTRRSGQWRPLGRATKELDDVISDTAHRLTTAADTLRVARHLLGSDGPTRVLIALQNNAEMRDQGMVLSYAVAETNAGALTVTDSGSISRLELSAPVRDVQLPVGTAAAFGYLAPLQFWQSVNATADTALAGRTMASMYRAKTGDRIDGVIALDVPAIAGLLAVTGPVSAPGVVQPITADNAASLLLNDLYAAPLGSAAEARTIRQEEQARVMGAVIERIRGGSLNTAALVRALGTAAAQGHAWVTSQEPMDQAALERAGLSGRPGRLAPERTIHIAVQNGTATKLDWFVDPVVDVDVHLTEDGTAVIKTTVTLQNRAPIPTPSSEQFGPDNFFTHVPGQYLGRVHFWGPRGGDQVGSVEESGLQLNVAPIEVMPGKRAAVTFSTILPGAASKNALHLRFVPQPRVHPMRLRVKVNGLGWNVTPLGTQAQQWDHTLDLRWHLQR